MVRYRSTADLTANLTSQDTRLFKNCDVTLMITDEIVAEGNAKEIKEISTQMVKIRRLVVCQKMLSLGHADRST